MSTRHSPPVRDLLAGLSGFQGRDLLPFLIEHAPIGIAVARFQREAAGGQASCWRYVLANQAYCAMPGTAGTPIASPDPLVGRTLAEVFPPATAESIACILDEVRRTGQAAQLQEFEAALGPSRERTWWNVSDHPLFDDAGQVAAVLILIYDVTDHVLARQRAEALGAEAETERQRLQAVMGALPVGVAITEMQGGLLQTNLAYERIWGGPRPDADSVSDYGAFEAWWVDTGQPVAPEEWASAQAVLKGETVVSQVMEIRRFDGARGFVLNSAAPVRDATGEIVGSAVAIQDITEIRVTQDALRASEEGSRALFETMNEGLALHEMLYDERGVPYDYRFLEVNPAFERQTGLTAAQVLGRTVREVIPDIEPLWIERYGRVVTSGEPAHLESYSQALGRWYDVRAFRTQPGRFAALFLDVTDRRRTEQALRESEERLRLATDAAGVGTWDRDLRTGQVHWSASQFRLLGYEPEPDGLGSMAAWLSRVHPDDRDRIVEGMEAAQRTRSLYSVEYRIVRADDGRLAWVRVFGRYLYDGAGEAVRFIGVALDATAQREAQEALRVANETLEQRVAERTALAEQRAVQLRALAVELTRAEERERRRLAGLLHDHLQQLLAAAVLQMHVAQPKAAQAAQPALRQALDLLNEAIKASRSLTAELSPVILHDAGLVPALHWLGRWMREHHALQVTVEAPEAEIAQPRAPQALPAQVMPAEGQARPSLPEEIATLLFHSARELLFNVVKHAGVNRAVVQLSYPTPNMIQLVVSDEGRGFVVDEMPDSSLGGFGLFSIRERLAYMGGEFIAEGAPGRGTRVTLRVPLGNELEAEGAAAPKHEPEEVEPSPEPERQAPRKLRLLVVDDHPIVRKGLVGFLDAEPDLEVVGEAGDGLEAIARVREMEPDIVLMDLNMPRMDGIEATRRILAEFPGVRIIVLSMFDDSEKKALMQQIGAAGYVAKGGDPSSLLAAIRAS